MTLPSAVLDLSRWKITLPTGKSGSPTELVGSALQAADIPNTFWVGTDGAVHFRAAVTGVTTSGSGYPRSELRELNADGSLASWSSTDGKTHTMVVDEAVVRIPNPRTSGNAATVCAQIHDKDNDISVFRVEAGKVWVTQGDTTHFALADGNYVPGTRFKAMYTVANGTVTAFYNGTKVVSFPFKGSGLYFKAGAYVQANASNSKPADASNYGETAIWSVQVAHGAPVPVDPPVVTPPPVVDPPPVVTPPATQTLGVGGVATPSGAIVATADTTSPLTITKAGTYDGQGHKVGRITVKGDNITVQNYRVYGGGQYGVVTEGTNNTIQNNDIKGIKVSGDGDLNAITWFGNGTKLLFNTIENFIEGDPGDSHSDGAQTWVSSSHPVASSDVEIRGNRFVGPANPKRDPKVPSIHQCIMAEDYGRGGNSGGSSSGMKNWVVADNYFGDSWNQCIKLDGVDNVDITRNTFAGSSDKIVDLPQGSNVKFYEDNNITGSYKNGVGIPVTKGPGPGSAPAPTPTPDPVPVPAPSAGIKIQIIRHGEKPADANDHTLAPKGVQRANALPPIFTGPRSDLYKPTWIFASKGNTTSMRMLQTAQPTAAALGLPIDTSLDSENAVTQTAQLLAKQALAGETVLAVLEHSAIAAVASALVKVLGGKWNAKTPSSWDDSDFSSIWKFVGDGAGNWVFSKTDEGVLEGDPGYVKPTPVPVPDPVPDPVPVPDPTPTPVPDPTPQPDPAPVPDPAPPSTKPLWWAAFIAALLAALAAIGIHAGGDPGTTPPPPVPVTTTPAPTPVPTTITPAPTTTPSTGRAYPVHTGIVSTTFWVGEIFDPSRPDGSQVCSTYDSQWAYHWSGVKSTAVAGSGTDCAGSPLGGCDGVAGKNTCATEARKAPDFWPTKATPKENPFYLDLPFDDINDSSAFKSRCQTIPWANDPGYAGKCSDPNFSYMKNRWVKLTGPNGNTCYGQVEDAGPGTYHDAAYVFGDNDARPANREYNGAGADVSPSLNGCLGYAELDGENDHITWQFVDAPPPGPWTKVVTTSGVTS